MPHPPPPVPNHSAPGRRSALARLAAPAALGAGAVAAAAAAAPRPAPPPGPAARQDSAVLVAAVDSLRAPEAVRYDSAADVYYVSNWNEGPASALDNNGFISRVRPDGAVDRMRFIAGGANGVTLHAPRGMAIAGDTLWAADADAVRGFDRRTGAPVAAVSFAAYDPGFLNDVAVGPDGALYVTDTGRNRIYRIAGRTITVAAADSALGAPNGITWDAAGRRFVVVPFGGAHVIRAWRPAAGAPAARAAAARVVLDTIGESGGAQFDGVEVLAGAGGPRVLVASQADSSLHLFTGAAGGRLTGRPVVRLAGRPADIAVDTRRGRVAVPYVARNRVEIWQLPRGN